MPFNINKNVQCYIYSCQDLILKSDTSAHINAGDIYCVDFDKDENVVIYSASQAGVMLINANIITQRKHSQINYYDLGNQNILCEIKPFPVPYQYAFCVNKSVLKLVRADGLIIYFNNDYYGKLYNEDDSPVFEKISYKGKDYGLIKFVKTKYIILFNETQILYCGRYLDYEKLNTCLQIYEHIPNVFNIGKLIKCDFNTGEISSKCVNDRKCLFVEENKAFVLEYFMEAIKCDRYKYAYEKLSHELRADISLDILKQYFKKFDNYKDINNTDTYITFKNHKIVGVYRFELNRNFIDNIY